MKYSWFISLFILSINSFTLFGQADNCSAATPLSIGVPYNGTTLGATETIPGCTGTADDDVWFQFVATQTTHDIVVTPSAGMDAVVQLFRGPCSTLISLGCKNNAFAGGVETITYSNFVVGQTYRIRVYHYGVGAGSGNFSIEVTLPSPPPINDNCSNAIALNVNQTCSPTQGTTIGATPSTFPGCSGNADDDVWYKFTATSSVHNVTATTNDMIDLVMTIYAGTCSTLSTIACVDNSFTGGTETIQLVGLTVGATYYIRIYDYYAGNYGDFEICVTGVPTPVPSNDEPCNAIQLPAVTSECMYMQFTTLGATKTTSAPAPFSCSGAISDPTGGFGSNNSDWPRDVWFAITVPATGSITITHDPSITGVSGEISDGVMALYSGTCSNLTQITCSENYNYPGTVYDNQPMLNVNNLTPGSTVYLRYWGYGASQGKFGFCVSTATNDDCEDALYICDINGYSASTSPAFTPDRPGNMHGNNETSTGATMPSGQNSGGPFGYYPYPGTTPGPYSSPHLDVEIDNNSWIKFTAAATSVTLNVSVFDCFKGNYPSGGIQMQIFDSDGNCGNFSPVSSFEENSTGFTITANNLTVGNDYLLMVDGFAGDICNYTISANSGVQFPEIPKPAPICAGDNLTLTAPSGATSYEWLHDGSTGQSVSVSPSTTQMYYCVVTGLCGQKQTLEVEVEITPSPILEFDVSDPTIICQGDAVTINVSGADNYHWAHGGTGSTITVAPTSNTTYTVTGTVSGCTATKSINVEVLPTPSVQINVDNAVICEGESATITASGANTYTWSNGATGNQITVSPSANTTYTVTGTNSDGCSNTNSQQITVNPTPNVSISPSTNNAICSGESITLTAQNASSYSWSNGSTNNSITVSPNVSTTYTVTGTSDGCSNTTQYTVNVNQTPEITGTPAASPSDCGASTGSITGLNINANNYTVEWFDAANNVVGNNIDIHNIPAGSYTMTVTTSEGCTAQYGPVNISNPNAPTVGITASQTSAICSGESVTLTANGNADSYSWSNGSTANSITVSPASTATYSLIGTANGCSSSASYTVNVNPLPTIDLTPSNNEAICAGEEITLTASGNADTYLWNNGSNESTIVTAPTEETTYTVIASLNGCLDTQSYTVEVKPTPSAPEVEGEFSVCVGEHLNLFIAEIGGADYSWTGPNGWMGNSSSLEIENTQLADGGSYCAHVTVDGCESPESCVEIVIHDLPSLELTGQSLICENNSANISAAGADHYNWTGPNNFESQQSDIEIDPFSSNNSGYYYVEGTDMNGCSVTDSLLLEMLENPEIYLQSDEESATYCESSMAVLTANGGDSYTWTTPNNETITGNSLEIDPFTSNDAGWYFVSGADANGCTTTDSIQLIISYPEMSIDLSDSIICPGDPVYFYSSDGGTAYSWENEMGDLVSTAQNFSIDKTGVNDGGWYFLTYQDENNCTVTDSLFLDIALNPDCLNFPDLVTPNDDNLNDTWTIPGLEFYPNVQLEIYNRWGNLVFQTDHYDNNWGGEVNKGATIGSDNKVPIGTYFYILILNDDNNTAPFKGYIEVQY